MCSDNHVLPAMTICLLGFVADTAREEEKHKEKLQIYIKCWCCCCCYCDDDDDNENGDDNGDDDDDGDDGYHNYVNTTMKTRNPQGNIPYIKIISDPIALCSNPLAHYFCKFSVYIMEFVEPLRKQSNLHLRAVCHLMLTELFSGGMSAIKQWHTELTKKHGLQSSQSWVIII